MFHALQIMFQNIYFRTVSQNLQTNVEQISSELQEVKIIKENLVQQDEEVEEAKQKLWKEAECLQKEKEQVKSFPDLTLHQFFVSVDVDR